MTQPPCRVLFNAVKAFNKPRPLFDVYFKMRLQSKRLYSLSCSFVYNMTVLHFRGGGGLLPMFFLLLRLCSIFLGVIAQTPPPPPFIKNLMVCPWDAVRSYNFLCDERIWICMYHSRCFFYITERISSDNFRKLEATTKGFLSKRGAIFSQTWSNTLKTERGTQAVYC